MRHSDQFAGVTQEVGRDEHDLPARRVRRFCRSRSRPSAHRSPSRHARRTRRSACARETPGRAGRSDRARRKSSTGAPARCRRGRARPAAGTRAVTPPAGRPAPRPAAPAGCRCRGVRPAPPGARRGRPARRSTASRSATAWASGRSSSRSSAIRWGVASPIRPRGVHSSGDSSLRRTRSPKTAVDPHGFRYDHPQVTHLSTPPPQRGRRAHGSRTSLSLAR